MALSYFVPDLRGSVKIIWVAVTYILQGMAQTAVSVPLFTMMARLSSNQVERAKLGQFQSIASILANLMVPAVTLPMATAIGGRESPARIFRSGRYLRHCVCGLLPDLLGRNGRL